MAIKSLPNQHEHKKRGKIVIADFSKIQQHFQIFFISKDASLQTQGLNSKYSDSK